jgi:hypothetical protein
MARNCERLRKQSSNRLALGCSRRLARICAWKTPRVLPPHDLACSYKFSSFVVEILISISVLRLQDARWFSSLRRTIKGTAFMCLHVQ